MAKETNAEFLARLHARIAKAEAIMASVAICDKTCPEDRAAQDERDTEIRARLNGEKTGPLPARLRRTKRFRGGGETACMGGGQEER